MEATVNASVRTSLLDMRGELREGVSAGNAHRCKHIKKARDGFCNLMIKAMRQDQLDKIGKGRGWSG